MKKLFIIIFLIFVTQLNCFAQNQISFLYINGSNNNDEKMKNWYEKGVRHLHPFMKDAFEKSPFVYDNFLENGHYSIQSEPNIFFWGYRSHEDLSFVEKNLAISKGISTWLAYQIRYNLTKFLHDAIWVQKYHNMDPILDDLHTRIKIQAAKGDSVVLFGYSAGSFVTYEYLLSRMPYINVFDLYKNLKADDEVLQFIKNNPVNNTCMEAIGTNLVTFSIAGHVITNKDFATLKKDYLNLNNITNEVCDSNKSVRGIVNFASPLVLFYSDLSDPNFDLTYYNRLLFKYIIENDMFWLTVNYRNDPLGFPGGSNLSIEEIESNTGIDIEPHKGFMYDQSNTWSRNSAFATHTSYWATRKIFSRAVVRAYENGYRHEYDENFKSKNVRKFHKKFNIIP